ncbi:MAG: FAD-binding protein [Phenylobacterium sp.]|uniref:D-arabinono-1,4-lactone oxidase n=1 Tax=Phenylobacterium sp. TaxID=1871053 RepID=UPI001B41EBBE|nr:D-arabinono-1,4-lactone oxidase [Phenylobacterium sp.]MBP7816268.1 FAD-binding protein [Phenylobacterium sp.]MBP8246209.1 FAD-binding protein [Phenylobacterium sp.]MBP9232606.1 FAD-binding protein [Phenylobacterium sp.]MBP9754656.1 FAD-binding protein [Phenylobacterium sp.]
MISRRNALLAGGAGVVAVAGGGVFLATREKPEPAAPASVNAQGRMLWRNWSGIESAYPAVRSAPTSEAELAKVLKTTPVPIRPVGAGHSFTALVPTSGTLMTLDQVAGIARWEGDEAVVWTGTRLGALGPALAAKGRAMPNLPDINKQSLGGAIGTGTHGTGTSLKALHGDITALRLATVSGEILDCDASRNADVFNAARVSMGALGVITQVRLKTSENRRLHRHVWIEPLADTIAQAEARWAKHRNYEFYAVPFTDLAANITHDETDLPATAPTASSDDVFLEALKQLRNLLGFSTPLRKAAAKALLGGTKPEEAVGEGWKLLSTERPIRFNEMEFHLPPETQMAALKAVVAALETHRKDVFFPIELRRIAADDAWLSPFNGGPRGSVAVHCYYKDDYKFLFELIQPIFLKHGGRPHWGKLHSLKAPQLANLYPDWNAFQAVRRRLDPQGKMLNPYMRDLLGS